MARGTVKFYNSTKGFGFISDDGSDGDVFVHVSAVAAGGLHGLETGDQVEFSLRPDRRSGRTSAVDLRLIEKAVSRDQAAPRGDARGEPSRFAASRPTRDVAGAGSGTVKWYNPTKGFGFIEPSIGGTDVFVHASAVQRSGLGELKEGQVIAYDLEVDPRSGKASACNLKAV